MEALSVQSFSSDDPQESGDPLDDGELIRRAREGEADAFDVLVGRHALRLLRMVRNLTGTVEDAEDVTQETFAAAYFKLGSFAGRSSFFTWLYRIALNKAISQRRRRRLETTHVSQPLADAPEETPDAAEMLLRGEEIERLREAIACLEPDRRSVLVLRDVDGRDYGEIAEILNLPKGTVRSRLHRARCDLRQLLDADSPSGGRPAVGREKRV